MLNGHLGGSFLMFLIFQGPYVLIISTLLKTSVPLNLYPEKEKDIDAKEDTDLPSSHDLPVIINIY